MENTRLIGYELISAFCREHHLKGGAAIFVKDQIKNNVESINTQDLSEELICEVAAVKINTGKSCILLVGIYRNQGNVENSLEIISKVLESLPTNKPVVIMGDINIDSIQKARDYTLMKDILSGHNIVRLDLPPTRITPTSATSIDCVCTNINPDEITVKVINTGISDHTGQLCSIKGNSKLPPQPINERRNMSNRNLQKLKENLSQQNWRTVYFTNDTEESYNNFSKILIDSIDSTCPLTQQRNKKQRHALSDLTAWRMKARFLEAQSLYNNTGNEKDKRITAQYKKDYDLWLKHLRKQNSIEEITNADDKSRAIWRIINSERKSTSEKAPISTIDINGELTQDPTLIADHFNSFFTNIAQQTINSNEHIGEQKILPEEKPGINTLTLQPTNEQETRKLIQSLKTKTSTGYDNISTKLLKHCKEELTLPLVDIVNKSFSSGVFPSALKIAKVYPKYKQGPTTQAANYRPISLIPTFSKVIEKLVLTRLLQHLQNNQLLTSQQHGFLPGKSTTTALINLVEFLTDQLEEGNTASAIMLDYSKAFDCLSHDHLLAKLATLGIRGGSHRWFESYLTGRSQQTEVKYTADGLTRQSMSRPQTTKRGVPQGSVLGPVLFILYTNDFPKYMQEYCNTLMYADDTVLLLGKKQQEELEIATYTAVNMAVQYCNGNDLVVNEKKTKQLVLGRNKNIAGRLPELEDTFNSTYLGVTIDDTLSWNEHIDSLCKKLSIGLYVIRRMKNISDLTTAKTAYYALYESHLRYGIVVWGGTSQGNLQRVLTHQKRAIRLLANLQTRESCRQAFQELKILTMTNLYIYETITYVHLKSPGHITTGAQHHNHNTRHATNYCLPVHRLSSTEKKPTYAGAKLWNALPEELKSTDRQYFGRRLKQWLQDHPFYTLKEFYEKTGTT